MEFLDFMVLHLFISAAFPLTRSILSFFCHRSGSEMPVMVPPRSMRVSLVHLSLGDSGRRVSEQAPRFMKYPSDSRRPPAF